MNIYATTISNFLTYDVNSACPNYKRLFLLSFYCNYLNFLETRMAFVKKKIPSQLNDPVYKLPMEYKFLNQTVKALDLVSQG